MERQGYRFRKRVFGWKGAFALLLVLLAAGTATAYYASKRFVPLHDVQAAGASGEALIDTYGSWMPGERVIGIDIYHLKPNSVYTVWLVNTDTDSYRKAGRLPLGIDTNSFKTDGAGNGRDATTANEYDLENWRFIEVNYHPDGDPRNTKDMVTVLQGDMVYGYHS